MTLPSPPIWPPRSDEEYRRDKSPPSLFAALGVLALVGLALIAIGFFIWGNSVGGLALTVVVIALAVGILYVGSVRAKKG